MPLRHDADLRSLARTAYRTLEPFHIVAYFAPALREHSTEHGLHWRAQYVGMRAAPMGPCAPSVVAAAFFNFRPDQVAAAWTRAIEVGLTDLDSAREHVVDRTLRDCLGPAADDGELAELAGRLREVVQDVPTAGRPLAAAWAARPWPEAPHLVLWQASAVWREWRGDGHLAALVGAGLDPVEALVLATGRGPDGTASRSVLPARMLRRSRGWSEEEWAAGVDRLAGRGLVEADSPEVGGHRQTAEGAALSAHLEDLTDDASAAVWADVPDAGDVLQRVRPYVKKVIDAGFLPGTSPSPH